MLEELIEKAKTQMDQSIAGVERELGNLRTGRASASVLDGVQVEAYGSKMSLNQVATINIPDASLIVVQPFDPGQLAAIERAIQAMNIGLTPSNDGKIIRLPVPPLTEETRKEIVKKAAQIAEKGKVSIRGIRRQINDEIKKHEKDHDLPEDEGRRRHNDVQKRTDEHVKTITNMLAKKEDEIMRV